MSASTRTRTRAFPRITDVSSGIPGAELVALQSLRRNRRRRLPVTESRRTTSAEAKQVGDEIGVDWSRFELEQFRRGMDVEYEHGSHDPQTDVTGDDPIQTGKIALAHMKEFPDYYTRLERMEEEAARDWSTKAS
jgi:hypothetical protein